MPSKYTPGLLLAGFAALAPAGCLDALDAFEKDSNLLHVFTAHHATVENGMFPDRGDDDFPRVFQNDTGWTIHLLEGVITTTAMALVSCDGSPWDLDMYRGPCPEEMVAEDLNPVTVASREIDAGQYCQLLVRYGPYDPEAAAMASSPYPSPDAPEAVGASIYLEGYAENGGDPIPFLVRSTEYVDVSLDIAAIENGGPMTVSDANFPEQVTVGKTYDRFFDGVDFAAFDANALSAAAAGILAGQTRPSEGDSVLP